MIIRNPRLQRHVAEHPALKRPLSPHASHLGLAPKVPFNEEFFSSLLGPYAGDGRGEAKVSEPTISRDPRDAERFAEAVGLANIPTLLMVLVHLTGELRWLEDPYRPVRARGLGDNDTGGLPEPIQAEIRAAALQAILAWRAGAPVAMPEPSAELRVRMLGCAMGEEIPAEYAPMIEAQLGFGEPIGAVEKVPVPEGFLVLIIGAGVSGICAAVNLQRAGIPFRIVEKNPTVGGTWLNNRYPGAGVDAPNHLYSFSFATYDWSMYFALRDELWSYLEYVADKFDLRRHIRFETEVERAAYDESTQTWTVDLRNPDGSTEALRASVVISATGIFNPIKRPDVKGLERFRGPTFHTAEWPEDLDLSGKHVAIIGNGASAMQVGPEIQNDVASLTIFQRSPHWAAPFEQFRREVPDALRFLLREVPLYRAWYRMRLGWTFNDQIHPALQNDPAWAHPDRSLNAINDAHRAYFTRYIETELGDRRELLDLVLPTYPPWGKRMLLDNGWYRMLRNERVELVGDPIAEIGSDRVITEDGREYPADVLVQATGFDVLRFLTSFEARGGPAGASARCGTTTTRGRTWASPSPTSPTFSASTVPTRSPATAAACSSSSRCRCGTSWTSCAR